MSEMNDLSDENQEEKIDIMSGLSQGWKMFKKTWWLLLLFLVAGTGIMYVKTRFFYTPEYMASASFSVDSGEGSYASDYTTSVTMDQLSATFPYILESGALKDVVCEDLGVDALNGTITATVVESTNLFQMSVVSGDAQMADDILESVIKNYPTVARYIIGDTTLNMLDNTGVPTEPFNARHMKTEMAKGMAAAAVIYLLVLILLTSARRTVISEEDMKRYTSIRCLSGIPKTWLKKRSGRKKQLLLIDRKVTPSFVESFNTLRVRLLRYLKKDQMQVVLITSSSENEGKTTVAANLALSFALKGYHTLLIDGDLRNPSVAVQFDLTSAAGLGDVLQGSVSLKEAVVHYAQTPLDILASQQIFSQHKISRLLNGEEMRQLMAVCRGEYDFIFIDTPPCNMMQDAAALAEISDSALLVIRQDYVARDRILNGMELLAETGIRLLGYVINQEETGIGSYGYGKYGYGRYGYGKYGKYGQYGVEKKRETS